MGPLEDTEPATGGIQGLERFRKLLAERIPDLAIVLQPQSDPLLELVASRKQAGKGALDGSGGGKQSIVEDFQTLHGFYDKILWSTDTNPPQLEVRESKKFGKTAQSEAEDIVLRSQGFEVRTSPGLEDFVGNQRNSVLCAQVENNLPLRGGKRPSGRIGGLDEDECTDTFAKAFLGPPQVQVPA